MRLLLAALALPALKLLGTPGDLDQPLGASGLAAVLAAFFLWIASLSGWGSAFNAWFRWQLPRRLRVVSGIALAVIAPGIVMLFRWGPSVAGWVLTGISSLGLCLLVKTTDERSGVRPRRAPPHASRAIPLFLLFLPVGAGVLFLNMIQDTYSYHLYAPLRWWTAGSVTFDPGYPNLFSAQAWENLHFWPLAFFGGTGRALYAVQIFSQLTHAVLGFALAAWLTARLADKWMPISWGWAAAAAALFQPTLLWTAWNAKNDYGGLLFVLAAASVWLLWLEDPSRRRMALLSFFLGLAAATKLSLILIAAPFLALIWLSRGDRPASLGMLLVPFLLPLTPLLWRNFAATGNPAFPFLSTVFGGEDLLSESLRFFSYRNSLGEGAGLLRAPEILLRVWAREPALLFGPVLGFFLRIPGLRALSVAAFLSCLGLAIQLGPSAELFTQARLLAVPAALSLLLLITAVHSLLRRLRFFSPPSERRLSVAGWIVFGALLLRPHVPWVNLLELGRRPQEPQVLQERIIAGSCKRWAWNHTTPLDLVVWLEDDAMYFTPLAGHVSALHHPRFDAVLRDASETDFLDRAGALGASHVVAARHADGDHYYRFSPGLFRIPPEKRLVFSGKDCLVFSTRK